MRLLDDRLRAARETENPLPFMNGGTRHQRGGHRAAHLDKVANTKRNAYSAYCEKIPNTKKLRPRFC